MSLLQKLPYSVYSKLKDENSWAKSLAKHFKIRNARTFPELIEALDERGCSVEQFYEAIERCPKPAREPRAGPARAEVPPRAPRPTLKVAVLVANAHYDNWANLITPVSDCRALGAVLSGMGFVTVVLVDVRTAQFKRSIEDVCAAAPANSYLLFYFAGHGFELCGTKYMLGVESPSENYTVENGLSENFIIKCGFRSKPELFVLLLDMCRTQPDRSLNEHLYSNIAPLEEYKDVCNLIIGYATSPYMPAYEECCQPETESRIQHSSCKVNNCATDPKPNFTEDRESIGKQITEKLKSKRLLDGVSLYVNYLSRHLQKNEDFLRILEMVHGDFAKLQYDQAITQKPQKLDNVASRFYLSSKIIGDEESKEKISDVISKLHSEGIYAAIL